MNELVTLIPASPGWRISLISMLVAFVLSQAIAGFYAYSHRGLSYSRSLVMTLVASGILSSVLMLTIGGSLARGIGIIGTLALIRFRTNLHDPLDIIFVLASFASGVAAGTGNWATGAIGTAVFLLVMGMLNVSSFGAHRRFEGILRLQLPGGTEAEALLADVLKLHCKSFWLVTLREVMQGRGMERVYQLTLREPHGEAALVSAVSTLPGASSVALAMQEATVEL
jgi:hypothetical protein